MFDPVLEKYALRGMEMLSDDIEGMPEHRVCFRIAPQGVIVKNDGTADLWLRTYAGELNDEFSITLFIETGEAGEVIIKRNVDLISAGKKIEFNEGGMTVFSVGGWGIAAAEKKDWPDFERRSSAFSTVARNWGYNVFVKPMTNIGQETTDNKQ